MVSIPSKLYWMHLMNRTIYNYQLCCIVVLYNRNILFLTGVFMQIFFPIQSESGINSNILHTSSTFLTTQESYYATLEHFLMIYTEYPHHIKRWMTQSKSQWPSYYRHIRTLLYMTYYYPQTLIFLYKGVIPWYGRFSQIFILKLSLMA